MSLDRRRFLGLTVASVQFLAPRGSNAAQSVQAAPQLAAAVTLQAGAAMVRLPPEPAPATPVLAFNGIVPGPVLRIPLGGEVRAGLVNGLSQATCLHWHGVRIANRADGAAGLTQDPVAPQGRFDYRFTPPDPGIYWYHPVQVPAAADQVRRGLYGVLIVDEAQPPEVDKEVLVVLRDWSLAKDGQIQAEAAGVNGEDAGPLVTINAKAAPEKIDAAPGSRLRLRIVNVSVARIMVLAVRGARPLIFAIDGQPCPAFEPTHQAFPVGPGARFELVVDMPGEAGGAVRLALRDSSDSERDVLILTARGEARRPRPPFASAASNPKLPEAIELQNAKRFDLVVGGPGKAAKPNQIPGNAQEPVWSVNAVFSALPRNPAFSVRRGTPVVLGLSNKTAVAQAIHVHGHVMRQLHDLDDGWDPYWRDSVIIEPGKTHHVAFVADNPGKWLIASAMIDRAITGLSTWFAVS